MPPAGAGLPCEAVVTSRDREGSTALMHAMCKNQVDSVGPLLMHILAVQLTARDSRTSSALMHAGWRGCNAAAVVAVALLEHAVVAARGKHIKAVTTVSLVSLLSTAALMGCSGCCVISAKVVHRHPGS